MRYAARRVLAAIATLFLVSVIAFTVVAVLPGDAARQILGDSLATNQEAYHELRERLGLDQPLPQQYGQWLWSLVTGDLGISLRDNQPISGKIAASIPVTFQLAVFSLVIAVVVATPLGVVAAVRPNTTIDAFATSFAVAGVAVPNFFLGILLILWLAVAVPLFPPSGYVPFFEDPAASIRHMFLPALCLGTVLAAVVTRQLRSSLMEALAQDYVAVARSKGLTGRAVLFGHALRNAMIPVITVLGLQTGTLIGGSVIVETVFAIPGMGRLMVDSIAFRDIAVVQATLMVVAVAVLAANLLADLAYAVVDPRIRLGQ